MNTDEVHRKNKDVVEEGNDLPKEDTNQLVINEMRAIDDKINLNDDDQIVENIQHENEKPSEDNYYVKEEVSKSKVVSENLSKRNTEKPVHDAKRQKDFDFFRSSSKLEINNHESVQQSPTNKDQITGIIVKEANLIPLKERLYIDQVSKVRPIEEINLIYASHDDQKETFKLQNSHQEYQNDREIPASPYFTMEKYANEEEQNEETNKETYQANAKEGDSNGYIISDKLNFESTELNKNLRQGKQYSPEIKQEIRIAQPNQASDNEISKIYEVQIGHEKYIRPQESQLKPEHDVRKETQINQGIFDNPIIINENEEFINDNQGAKDIENPNLADFHVIDTEKDLDVPDGLEGPVPAVALPPPSNRRGYIAVPFNSK